MPELEILADELESNFIITDNWCNFSIKDASMNTQNYSLETELGTARAATGKGVRERLLVYSKGLQILLVNKYNDFNQQPAL